eukprot:COSAG05_NODE_2892_length_2535_cov_2.408867_6_plen_51_part_01
MRALFLRISCITGDDVPFCVLPIWLGFVSAGGGAGGAARSGAVVRLRRDFP